MRRGKEDESRLGERYVTRPWAVAPRGRTVIKREGY